ncbi:phytanoyl-CoA dioxygenase family protein [Niabella soli]|uniref:Phytanoyl-CoA dioxygenase n=1 Tax=Niabella soli DSM 19437 TaxID=929713 RepID=W0EYQ8_9BACT|nr:phytanoyl-CoA dioxygenase family protein [Niabella soli]AHF15955.1 phytanoyl-CoA dioxygenase [Niabella soli DSM 19437]
MAVPATILKELEVPYKVTKENVEAYNKNRFIKLKHVLSAGAIAVFNEIIAAQVDKMNTVTTALAQRDTYGKAFLQLFNLWRENADIRSLIFSRRLGKIAADLMQVEGVRMYHDQALFKEGGGGITPWHADQYYWPLETDKTITAWIPLQETPLEMGPLEFSAGSHQIIEGRDLSIGDESETFMEQRLKVTDFEHIIEPFDAGEVSFHSGWVFHRAGANTTPGTRRAMTIIYMDRDMKLIAPKNKNQQLDWDTWCPGAAIGAVINTPMNPVLYDRNQL